MTDPAFPEPTFATLTLPAQGFETFTFPRYRSMVLTEDAEGPSERLAVGASLGGRPVGLALLSRPFGEGERRLLSIMVSHSVRRAGIGSRLLAHAEDLARDNGARKLSAEHSTRLASRVAYEALMRKASWSAPSGRQFRLAGKAVWAVEAERDWAAFLARLRERGFSTSPWTALTPADREEIAVLVANELSGSDQAFNPLPRENRLDALPELSFLLRRDGRVVGWLLASRGALPGTVHYGHGYVLPSLQRSGWLIAGVQGVCARQIELFGPDTLAIFETDSRNDGMRRFMERQLDRYRDRAAGWMDARLECEKSLSKG
jgi:GNAT superfamily N-acetyltransferase